MSDLDPVTWRLLLCCVIAVSACGWMLYYLAYEAPVAERDNPMLWVYPFGGIGMTVTIITLSEIYKRKKISVQ